MGGVTTDICLIFPSMSAVQEGFEVRAVLDASGLSYEIQEEMALRWMEHAGVVLTTTNTEVATCAGLEPFARVGTREVARACFQN
jgi:hypothetical protein